MSDRRRRPPAIRAGARRGPLGYAVASLGTGMVTGVLLAVREGVSPTNVVLAFLAVVFASAAVGGLGPGLLACGLGFLAFDVLFLPPYNELRVHDPQDLVSLVVYVAVALAVSTLVELIRRRQEEAERRERESRVLYELSSSLVARGGLGETLDSVVRTVRSLFELAGCAVVLADQAGEPYVAARAGDTSAVARALGDGTVRVRGPELGLDPGQALTVPMQGAEGPVGVLVVVAGGPDSLAFGEAERRVLATFANQAALAVEQRQLEQERARARELEETDRLRTALLDSVSHDLRTPLASIKGSVTSLLDAEVSWPAAERAEFLATIDAETDRLTHLVANLLDMSRLEAGDYRPDIVEVELAEIALPVVETARGRCDQRISVELAPDLPPLLADPVRLDQVLTNLLDNARRYAPGSPVEVTATADGGMAEIRVADHGPGIPAAERERVFQQFYRLKGGGRRPEGTGMGLAICRGIAEALGGTLTAGTTPGGGATFALRLPAANERPRRVNQ